MRHRAHKGITQSDQRALFLAAASVLCSDNTFNVSSQNDDHVEVIGLKATPKIEHVGRIE